MNTRKAIVQQIIKSRRTTPKKESGKAFAPSNIALCKYWGKRNLELNLPITSSLSVSLAHKGSHAKVTPIDAEKHEVFIDNEKLPHEYHYAEKLSSYLDLFGFNDQSFKLELNFNIPVASGLASSACCFASLVKAMDDLYEWEFDGKSLSLLARLGSGSASRSVYNGFVEWHHGERPDGMDSYATLINEKWPSLCLGLCIISKTKKAVSSREGMQRTVKTSDLYCAWPEKAEKDLVRLKIAIEKKDFDLLGRIAESNAMAMHATMLAAWPPLLYSQAETITLMQQVWALRQGGMSVYFTQDAGPNLKLLFLESNLKEIQTNFPTMELIKPFDPNE
ncbi:diphosphomevalonate decarboxylase [Candidiatus Paracoxiella cheracis]|uniref:diphosphomevalonate decarboxylase n=1 Tax=Candidiatus Paracoxiella cheracis TaxID=3405120 RepID=UPI003BF4FE6D